MPVRGHPPAADGHDRARRPTHMDNVGGLMNRNLIRLLVVVGVLSALVVGCGKSAKPTAPSNSVGAAPGADPSIAAGLDAVTGMGAADRLAGQPFGATNAIGLPLTIPTGCSFDPATQSFVCGPNTLPNGLTETSSFQFRDASDTPQTAFDSLTTASIHFASHLSGTTTGPLHSTIDDQRTLLVSGLAGTETSRTWNGTGNSARQDSIPHMGGGKTLLDTHVTTTIDDVVLPVAITNHSWPLSGTITTHKVVTGGLIPIDQTATLVFDGTRFAKLTINGVTYTIDLGRLFGWHGTGPIAY